MLMRALAAGVLAAAVVVPVHAQDRGRPGNVHAGREFAVTACSECHVVVPRRLTPRRVVGPPDFVDVANATATTRTALFVFLHSPHPTMPSLVLSDRESNDAITYILSLRNGSRRAR